jgi:hypothetical protein
MFQYRFSGEMSIDAAKREGKEAMVIRLCSDGMAEALGRR